MRNNQFEIKKLLPQFENVQVKQRARVVQGNEMCNSKYQFVKTCANCLREYIKYQYIKICVNCLLEYINLCACVCVYVCVCVY